MKKVETAGPATACKRLSIAVALSALGACDTGGSDERGDLLSGVFMEGAVEGVRYRTSSQSGLTGAGGGFTYREGETVTFSLGGITLGSAPATERIDLFDLYGLEPPTGEVALRAALANTEVIGDFDRVANIALLLATLDNDRRLDNGVDVSGWDQQLADTGLDVDKNLYAFPSERGPDTLTALKTAFAIDYSIPVTVPLPYLYRTLGIQVPAHLPVLRKVDFDIDGTVDSLFAADYDQLGRLTGHRYDNDVDGSFEIISESGYDAAYRPTNSESRSDGDGDGTPRRSPALPGSTIPAATCSPVPGRGTKVRTVSRTPFRPTATSTTVAATCWKAVTSGMTAPTAKSKCAEVPAAVTTIPATCFPKPGRTMTTAMVSPTGGRCAATATTTGGACWA